MLCVRRRSVPQSQRHVHNVVRTRPLPLPLHCGPVHRVPERVCQVRAFTRRYTNLDCVATCPSDSALYNGTCVHTCPGASTPASGLGRVPFRDCRGGKVRHLRRPHGHLLGKVRGAELRHDPRLVLCGIGGHARSADHGRDDCAAQDQAHHGVRGSVQQTSYGSMSFLENLERIDGQELYSGTRCLSTTTTR